MYVIISGMGEVGSHIADRLTREGHSVAVVEPAADRQADIRSKLDVKVVSGSGASAEALEEAGIASADLFIAVANQDEVNLISCMLAHEYGVERKIARIKSLESTDWNRNARRLGIDLIITPQSVVAEQVFQTLTHAAASEVVELAGGQVVFVGYKIGKESPLAGSVLRTLAGIRDLYPMVVTGITRGDETIIPRGDDEIAEGDIVYFVCNRRDEPAITAELFGVQKQALRSVFLLGGTPIGVAVAKRLLRFRHRLKLLEPDQARCEQLAEALENVLVLNTDGTDLDTLKAEGIEEADVFIATTDDDRTNILASLLAKRYGAKRVLAVANKPEWVRLAPSLGVDVCVSPRLSTAGAILKFVRRGDVEAEFVVGQGNCEVLALMMPQEGSMLGKPLRDLGVPPGSIIGAIVRGSGVIIPGGNDAMEPGDQVIVFTLPEAIRSVERFFAE